MVTVLLCLENLKKKNGAKSILLVSLYLHLL